MLPMQHPWQDIVLPPGNEDLVWELFHENSKRRRYDQFLSDEEVAARMAQLHQSLPIVGASVVELPRALPLDISLGSAIASRTSCYTVTNDRPTLEQVATLLHYAYGVTRDNKGTTAPRPFRAAPSAGALYPLEIFFHSVEGEQLKAGLYHYNPIQNNLRLIQEGDATSKISQAMVQTEIPLKASLMMFITAVFERTTFKYADRGYRFIFLEAGHVAQNMNLVATALGLGSINIGGYFDREIDDFLGIDGLTHSTIYMIAVGRDSAD
jgi:SagB-type dehydrogenase family enzyme